MSAVDQVVRKFIIERVQEIKDIELLDLIYKILLTEK